MSDNEIKPEKDTPVLFDRELILFAELPEPLQEIFAMLDRYIDYIQCVFKTDDNRHFQYIIEVNRNHNIKNFQTLLRAKNYNYITIHYSYDDHIVYIVSTLKYIDFYNDFFEYRNKKDYIMKKNEIAIIKILGDFNAPIKLAQLNNIEPVTNVRKPTLLNYMSRLVDDNIVLDHNGKYELSELGKEYYDAFLKKQSVNVESDVSASSPRDNNNI